MKVRFSLFLIVGFALGLVGATHAAAPVINPGDCYTVALDAAVNGGNLRGMTAVLAQHLEAELVGSATRMSDFMARVQDLWQQFGTKFLAKLEENVTHNVVYVAKKSAIFCDGVSDSDRAAVRNELKDFLKKKLFDSHYIRSQSKNTVTGLSISGAMSPGLWGDYEQRIDAIFDVKPVDQRTRFAKTVDAAKHLVAPAKKPAAPNVQINTASKPMVVPASVVVAQKTEIVNSPAIVPNNPSRLKQLLVAAFTASCALALATSASLAMQ